MRDRYDEFWNTVAYEMAEDDRKTNGRAIIIVTV